MRRIENINELTEDQRNNLSGYDKTLIECHLSNYGCVYLDEYDKPMEVEDIEYM